MFRPIMVLALAASAAVAPACRDSKPESAPSADHAERSAPKPATPGWKALYDRWTYPAPIPPFTLVDHRGQRFSLGDYRGDHVLLGFIYTRCPLPEACPLTVAKMRRVQERWSDIEARGEDRGRDLRLLGITLDPEHDSPERLRAYAAERGLDLSNRRCPWTLATGPGELVTSALPSLFNVLALPRAPGDIQHTVKVALLAPGLTLAKEWKDNDFTVSAVIDAVLDAAPSSE